MEEVKLKSVKFIYDGKNAEQLKNRNKERNFENKNLVTYSWENINVSVAEKKDEFSFRNFCSNDKNPQKQILKDVSGIAKPGQLLAIMGSSGSGKTTLLDVLNFRNKLNISGNIRINGELIQSGKPLSFICGYVTQDDLFFETLTVKEHLTFHAMLRLSHTLHHEERKDRVEAVLNDLNLRKCENTSIGNPERGLKGISNGEKRRLAVATELLANASLLMADEPTSGLDSFMASAMIECLKNLAKQGKTIICTIHQPSSDVFRLFDQLYLLAEGRLAFSGSLYEASQFFSSMQLYCPSTYNPADFYIQKLAIVPSRREECLENVHRICDSYEKSRYFTLLQNELEQVTSISTLEDNFIKASQTDIDYNTSSLTQIKYLVWRSMLNAKRNKFSTYIRSFQSLFFAVMFGLIYFQQDLTEGSVRNINGVLFLILINTSFQSLISTCVTFSFEIPIVLKEHTNGMYRIINYFISKIISELPLNIVIPAVYLTVIYFMADLNSSLDRYFTAVGFAIFIANIGIAFGGLLSAVTPSATIAFKISGAVMVPLNIFGGYYLNKRTVPDYFLWLRYLSWISYGNEIFLVNQWDGITNITCSANSTLCPPGGLTGDMILKQFEMEKDNFNMDAGIMVGIYFGFRIITYLVLLLRAHRYK